MNWVQGALTDENGQGDIAYVGVAAIIIMFVFVALFMCVMVLVGYIRDRAFDPMPLAQAFALVTGAVFGTGLAGLTAYMLATRKQQPTPVAAP